MLLDLPSVGVTVDPTWATKLNTALTTVDEHDHTSDKGVQVPTAGLNINADLSLQSNDLTEIRSLSLNNNVSTLPSGDVRALYASGGNLYYNNNSGTAIQITTGSSLNTGALALNVWEIHELAGNLTLTGAESYVFIDTDTSSGRTINLPPASSVTGGRYFVIKDKTGDANTNNITISPNGSDTIDGAASSTTISSSYGSLIIVSDGVSAWLTNGATGGFIQLGGDLLGTGSTVTAPRVGTLTGIASLVTMSNNVALNSRNAANSINVNLAKVSGSDVATYGDSQVAGSLTGTALTLTAGTTSITATANTSISATATTSMTLAGTTTSALTAGTALTLTGGTTAALTATAGALTLTGGTTASITGATGFTATATTGNAAVTATAGIATLNGGTSAGITAGTFISLGATTDVTLSAGDDITLGAVDEIQFAGKMVFPAKAVTSTPYTVDTSSKDYVVLIDTSAIAASVTINLPTGVTGRVITFKDVGGAANTYNITLTRVGGESIEGVAANYVMDADYQGVTLACYGSDWFIVGTA